MKLLYDQYFKEAQWIEIMKWKDRPRREGKDSLSSLSDLRYEGPTGVIILQERWRKSRREEKSQSEKTTVFSGGGESHSPLA